MKAPALMLVMASVAMGALFPSCTSRDSASNVVVQSKEALFSEGHRLYLIRSFDSAQVTLQRSSAMDSTYSDPIADLAALHFDLAMAEPSEKSPARIAHLKAARKYFIRLETLGNTDFETYDRLCQIANALDDDRLFLRYAKKSADQYPHDRQYYNLGLAYFNVEDYQNVIKSQKVALEKFKQSVYLGGFYRQLGRAYTKIERNQTAMQVMETGIKEIDGRLAAMKREGKAASADVARLKDDKIAIMQILQRLYKTYHENEKLKVVEGLLKDSGVSP